MRMESEHVRFRRVAFEKARLRLPYIHHVQKRSVGQQFDKLVWGRGCRGHAPIDPGALEVAHELAECLCTAESAQNASFIQTDNREQLRIKFAIDRKSTR